MPSQPKIIGSDIMDIGKIFQEEKEYKTFFI
jgi:hypothetical protein